ncbi:hypothetical protein M436DRAFT_71682 [Aureobasidium namibiae CBS 147.97]|uniref:Uncharacterized protein n=1 Tax=Aureobasidium namibiae CBS 147.97 TaxID=1043004 RepID=A0A074XI15_9PEZI|nr:uncharacterized protein M436DRAFT_71682 [Aureobasidium namibiae CBS 147.97]KEQ74221.1 hypothetical protein M436DRAFT_71682 [Aureobasidium namibiae CBS 147.97]
MLLHLSKLPDVLSDSVPCKENDIHTIEDIDLGNCPLTWPQQAQQYKQANTFAAIYTSALSPSITHERKSMQHTTLHCLSQAPEVEISTHRQIRRAGIHIPAASAWLLHAAPRILKFCNSKELYHGNLEWRSWLGGSDGGKCLWSGDEGFSVERWVFWKHRFGVVVGLGRRGFASRVVDDVVGCARRAGKVMREVEQEDGFAVDGVLGLFGRDDVSSLVL